MAVVKNLMVRAGADFSELEKKLRTAQKNMADTAKKMNDIGNGMKNVGAKMTAGITAPVVGGFLAVTQGTRELRQDLGKLDAQFIATGHGAGVGRDIFTGFYGILGESDTAIEAVNHLAELTKNQKELNDWVTIGMGVYAKFGDSLPLEGLTEAANETAKVGKVTGPLADALNWVGINEDKFNESLAACNTEAERATLITDTLSDAYTGVAAEYRKANGEVIDANEANAQLAQSLAALGKAVEPIMTVVVQGVTQMIEGFNKLPGPVKKGILIFVGLAAAIGPILMVIGTIMTVLPGLGTAFGVVAGILTGPVVLAVAAVIAIGVLLIKNWDRIKAFGVRMWDGIKTAWQNAGVTLRASMQNAGDAIMNVWASIKGKVLDAYAAVLRFKGAAEEAGRVQLEADTNTYRSIGTSQSIKIGQAGRRNGLGFGGYASGTNWHPGGLAWVGEQGPELVNLPRGSQVFNNQESRAIANQTLTVGGVIRVEGVNDMNQLVGVAQLVAREIEQGDRRLAGRVRVMPSMA